MTLPVSENWIADFNNLRCKRDYLYDSGWQYGKTNSNVSHNASPTYYAWLYNGGVIYCNGLAETCTSGGYTYYKGSLAFYQPVNYPKVESWYYYIKRTKPMTEYKSFSSF